MYIYIYIICIYDIYTYTYVYIYIYIICIYIYHMYIYISYVYIYIITTQYYSIYLNITFPVLSFGQPSWLLPVHQHAQLSAADSSIIFNKSMSRQDPCIWRYLVTYLHTLQERLQMKLKMLKSAVAKLGQAANSSPLSIAVFIARTRESSFWQPCPQDFVAQANWVRQCCQICRPPS